MINNLKIIIFSILAVVVVLYIPVILNICSATSSYPRDTLAADNAKGRRTDFNVNTNNSSFTNKSKFTNYINVDLPYMAHNISSLLNERNLVHSGMIILRNANQLVQGELDFEPWGQTEKNNLTIDEKNGTPPLFIMSGSTGKDYAGFELKDLDYRGNYISLVIGKSAKSSAIDYQISFTFTIEGNHGNYILTFVRGTLYPRGWIGNHYYEKINAYSSRLISLRDLIADDNLYLRKIDLVMQNNSILNSLEFRIDLDRTTENPPVVLPGGNSYFVVGDIRSHYNTIVGYSRTILHNLGISRLVELEFSSVPDNNKLVENGWDVTSIYKWKDNKTNLTNILLKAERQVTFPELLSPTVIFNLDIYRSIITLTSKDWLFLIVLITPSLSYYFRGRF